MSTQNWAMTIGLIALFVIMGTAQNVAYYLSGTHCAVTTTQ